MRMRGERLRVFSGTAHPRLAQDICSFMGVPLGAASLQRFPDGEINLKVECDVRGADVFVVQPTSPNVHEHLFELLSFADCLRRASADRVQAGDRFDPLEVFGVLVAQLPLDPQPQGRAVGHRQGFVVQPVGDYGLGVKGIH